MTKSGITFDDKWHTWNDWSLNPVRIYISMPDIKEQLIDIPGGDGCIDLTEINGRPTYGLRNVELEYHLRNVSNQEWHTIFSKIGNAITGRKVKMVLDDEPNYYYMVRLNLDGEKTDYVNGEITMSGTAEPFKYDIQSSAEDWLWDTFNFETGVIRTLKDITIDSANRTIKILGAGIDTPPVFVVTRADNLKLTHEGRTYTLKVGRNRFPAVRVGEQDVILTFSGSGTMAVEYRGRYL